MEVIKFGIGFALSTVIIVLLLFYVSYRSDKIDKVNKKFFIDKKSRFDIDFTTTKVSINLLILIPMTFISSVLLANEINELLFSSKGYQELSLAFASLSVSSFGFLLLIQYIKGKSNFVSYDISYYLEEEGYYKFISFSKYLVAIFFLNLIISRINIIVIDELMLINLFQLETVALFLAYLYLFLKCISIILKFRKFDTNKYFDSLPLLYKNYTNTDRKISVNNYNDLMQIEKCITSEIYRHINKWRQHKKIEYIKVSEFRSIFKKGIYLFKYKCFYLNKFNILYINLISSFFAIYVIYCPLLFMLFKILFPDIKISIPMSIYCATFVILIMLLIFRFLFVSYIKNGKQFYESFTMMLLNRNKDYNRFIIGDNFKHIEENLCLFKNSYSKRTVLLMASIFNALQQLPKNTQEDNKNFRLIITNDLTELCEEYYLAAINGNFRPRKKKRYFDISYIILKVLKSFLTENKNEFLMQDQDYEIIENKCISRIKKLLNEFDIQMTLKRKDKIEKKVYTQDYENTISKINKLLNLLNEEMDFKNNETTSSILETFDKFKNQKKKSKEQ